jgi:hypothetical protein
MIIVLAKKRIYFPFPWPPKLPNFEKYQTPKGAGKNLLLKSLSNTRENNKA